MAKKSRKLTKNLVAASKKSKRYSKQARDQVKKEVSEFNAGILTKNKNGGELVETKRQAVAKGLNISDSKKKKREKKKESKEE